MEWEYLSIFYQKKYVQLYMNKKKVLAILWHPDGVYTGGSFVVAQHSLKMYKKDEDVTLYILDKDGSHLEHENDLSVYTYKTPKSILKIRKVSFLLYRLCELLVLPFIIYRAARRIIILHDIEILYIPIAELIIVGIPTYVLKRKFKLRAVGLLHSVGGQHYNPRETIREMVVRFHTGGMSRAHALAQACLFRFLNKFQRTILSNFDDLMTVSNEIRHRLELWLGGKVYPVLRLGFDYTEYDEVSEIAKKYDAVFLSRLNEQKGLIDLVEAWNQIVAHRPEAQLLIIGDGEESFIANIKSRIRIAGIEKNITFAGIKFGEEKVKLLKASRVFLFPSHFESHAIVIDEAIACNLPIVAWDLPVYENRVNNAVYFARVPFGDIHTMTKTVLEVLDGKHKANTTRPRLPTWDEYHASEKHELLYGKSF